MVAIDSLKHRNRRLRDVGEKSGSIALAGSAVVGLLFLLVLVWQIAFVAFALAQLNKQKWVERAGFLPLLLAFWMTVL